MLGSVARPQTLISSGYETIRVARKREDGGRQGGEDPEPHKEAGQEGPGEGTGRDQHCKNIWNTWRVCVL